MKKLLTICAVLLIAGPALAAWNDVHVTDANTLGLWHFDEQTGATTTADVSGNGNTASVTNPNLVYNTDLDPNLTWQTSMAGFGNAATTWWNSSTDLNNGALYVDQTAPNDSLRVGATDMTIEMWLNPQYTTGFRNIITKYTGGNYAVFLDAGKIRLGWYMGGWQSVVDTTVLAANTWTHVAVTMDRTTDLTDCLVNFWINGQLSSYIQSGLAPNYGTANKPLYMLGRSDNHGNSQYYGGLDEVRISDTMRYAIPEPSMMLLALGALAIFRKKQ